MRDGAGAAAAARRRLAPTVAFEDVTLFVSGRPAAGARRPVPSRRAGERVAIVGPSGSGKSTVARLLLRFHDPEQGRVLVGGRDVATSARPAPRASSPSCTRTPISSTAPWTRTCGWVSPTRRRPSSEAAARDANAHEFIARLPQGYQTVVGERGVRLSGGQRQRIAIARALLRDAPILILDEALSSVDAESEALIQAALDRLMAGRTTLIFAHRLSSVIGADRILVLDDGRVVESGRACGADAAAAALSPAHGGPGADARYDGAGRAAAPSGSTVEPAARRRRSRRRSPRRPSCARHGGVLGPGWAGAADPVLLGLVAGLPRTLVVTFLLGVARVAALIGVGAVSALAVLGVKRGARSAAGSRPSLVVAPLAGLLHWLESWLAHDMAYRLLADMRLEFFRALDALAPAYLTRRRTGDLVGVATHDIELIEYFFAHTITPAFVGRPRSRRGARRALGLRLADRPGPAAVPRSTSRSGPCGGRARIDRLGARAREAPAL